MSSREGQLGLPTSRPPRGPTRSERLPGRKYTSGTQESATAFEFSGRPLRTVGSPETVLDTKPISLEAGGFFLQHKDFFNSFEDDYDDDKM